MQGEAISLAVDDPDARAIIADMKRDADFILLAGPDMHDDALGAPGIVFCIVADDPAFESLATEGGEPLHELRFLNSRLAACGQQQRNNDEEAGTHRAGP